MTKKETPKRNPSHPKKLRIEWSQETLLRGAINTNPRCDITLWLQPIRCLGTRTHPYATILFFFVVSLSLLSHCDEGNWAMFAEQLVFVFFDDSSFVIVSCHRCAIETFKKPIV